MSDEDVKDVAPVSVETRPRPPKQQQRKRDKRDVHGWAVLDKPVGMTSTHAVAVIKRLFSAKRVGHAGTLDPLASGCLPIILQLVLIIPMYTVISQGLTNHDVNQMLNVVGQQVTTIECPAEPEYTDPKFPGQVTNPCLDPVAFGINWGITEPQTTGIAIASFGISFLAILSAFMQLIQSRMTLPAPDPRTADDPQIKVQRQMAYFLPLISIAYGGFLPAGLFLYWIAGTLFSIAQQYLIIGWGGTFPLFGWTPGFARDHTPRFPVKIPEPRVLPAGTNSANKPTGPRVSSNSPESTIRPNRTRGGRRGRRR